MKTKSQNQKSGLKSRPEQLNTERDNAKANANRELPNEYRLGISADAVAAAIRTGGGCREMDMAGLSIRIASACRG